MHFARFGAALVAGAMTLAVHSAAVAASPATEAFLANLQPNVDFLDQSSRFALSNSKSTRVRGFAMEQAREQTLAANALDDWRQAAKGDTASVAVEKVAATTGGEQLLTGRSVAVADSRLPMGQEDLDSLEGLTGPEFDQQFRDKQRDALLQVEADYRDYIAHGDDPVLLALAGRELPKVRRSIASLGRI